MLAELCALKTSGRHGVGPVTAALPAERTNFAVAGHRWAVVKEGRIVVRVAKRDKVVIDDVPNALCRDRVLERTADKGLALGSQRLAEEVDAHLLWRGGDGGGEG